MELCANLIVHSELMGMFRKDSVCHANLLARVAEKKLIIVIHAISKVFFHFI
jgi:hypothetical protein